MKNIIMRLIWILDDMRMRKNVGRDVQLKHDHEMGTGTIFDYGWGGHNYYHVQFEETGCSGEYRVDDLIFLK